MEDLLDIIKSALNWFTTECIKHSDNSKDNKEETMATYVSDEIKNCGGLNRCAKNFERKLKKDKFISNESLDKETRLACAKYYVAREFQYLSAKDGTNVSFAPIFDKSFKQSISKLNGKVFDKDGNVIDLKSYIDDKVEKQELNELLGALVKFTLKAVCGWYVGDKIITPFAQKSPAICSFVRNVQDSHPWIFKGVDLFTWTDLETLANQDRINKGEITQEELDQQKLGGSNSTNENGQDIVYQAQPTDASGIATEYNTPSEESEFISNSIIF